MREGLFTPGPTVVPEDVLLAGAEPMIHHRSAEFEEILQRVRKGLKYFTGCDGEAVVFASSGSGGMEACVASLFAPGEEVVIVEGGKFGERWVELARHYNLAADVVRVPWGRAVSPEEVLKRITPKTRGILLQACETSTGVDHPVQEIARAIPKDTGALLVVDAISSLGIQDLSLQRDGLDVVVGASQKGFMCPPGLAMVLLGRRALGRLAEQKPKSFYFSLQRELQAQQRGQTGFTPAVSLIRSLDCALSRMERTGKEKIFRNTRKLQLATRAAFREDGLDLFNPDDEAACGITVVRAPRGLDVAQWLADLRAQHGLWLAAGQESLEGKIFRIAHMGALTAEDLLRAIETIENSLAGLLPKAAVHEGLKKAREILQGRGP